MSKLNVAVIGYGAIADHVITAVLAEPLFDMTSLLCREASLARAAAYADGRFTVVTTVDQLDPTPDVLIDCAGHEGLKSHGPAALKAGIEVLSISTGALADAGFALELEACAKAGNVPLTLLPGAIGGTDVIAAAATGDLDKVVYTGRKPPKGWRGSRAETVCDLETLTEPFEHFNGTAREAATLYPTNANVAATLALVGVGMDKTEVRLLADPDVSQNTHEIVAEGSFGKVSITVQGNTLPNNPKSSALAAMSIVAELKRRLQPIQI
ncbi:MAG: aspartate dehydrogenase [Proteobacteria bacterium]|nr:aspartate dehydrogenase [Pseudomonadota bacterium]